MGAVEEIKKLFNAEQIAAAEQHMLSRALTIHTGNDQKDPSKDFSSFMFKRDESGQPEAAYAEMVKQLEALGITKPNQGNTTARSTRTFIILNKAETEIVTAAIARAEAHSKLETTAPAPTIYAPTPVIP